MIGLHEYGPQRSLPCQVELMSVQIELDVIRSTRVQIELDVIRSTRVGSKLGRVKTMLSLCHVAPKSYKVRLD